MTECQGVQGTVWRAMRLAGTHIGTRGAWDIVQVLSWFIRQQPKILNRFDPGANDKHTLEGLEYWRGKFEMYLGRAELLGFESPQGRQAICEFAATALGLSASVWRLYGPPASVEQDFCRGVFGSEAARKP